MFRSPDSPAITSLLSLCLSGTAAVLVGLYFSDAIQAGAGAALIVGMVIAFGAVVAGMCSFSRPEPGLTYALLGIGIGVAVIVLGFLVFLLDIARSQ